MLISSEILLAIMVAYCPTPRPEHFFKLTRHTWESIDHGTPSWEPFKMREL